MAGVANVGTDRSWCGSVFAAANWYAFGRLAWVRGVSVRRRWPGGLEVALDEHVPLARWGERALVNVQGEVFEAAYEGPLPRFSGPANHSSRRFRSKSFSAGPPASAR